MKIIDKDLVASVRFDIALQDYDYRLCQLGKNHSEFIVINPELDHSIIDYIDLNVISDKCVVWKCDDVWIAKKFKNDWNNDKGWKIVEIIVDPPIITDIKIKRNFDLPNLFDCDALTIDEKDFKYEHIWFYNDNGRKIWVYKKAISDFIIGKKDMGFIEPRLPKNLDVFFISYFEPIADKNWARLKSLVPSAQRIDGVKGILKAHQTAALKSKTDMFYVVDGDSWVLDDFDFSFQPNIFDRDSSFIWYAQNPITGHHYGNGGIKLLNKFKILNFVHSNQLDFSLSFSDKIKVIPKISSVNTFASDEFHAWKAAFRENIKLLNQYQTDEIKINLSKWLTITSKESFAEWVIKGVSDAYEYFENFDNFKCINDIDWLKNYFDKKYEDNFLKAS